MENNNDKELSKNKNKIKDSSKRKSPLKRKNNYTKRKRRNTFPLRSSKFKISSIEESEILSKICDNIFEDVNVKQKNNIVNNKSMKNLFSNIVLKRKESNCDDIINDDIDTININDESKAISSSKTFDKDKKNKNKINDEDESKNRGVRQHRNSFMFNNLIKYSNTKIPKSLEDDWMYEKILLDYNIIDFTSKFIYFII